MYCTRLQKERTDGTLSSDIVIDKSVVSRLKQTSIIMHPLPRNNEISADVDDDPRAVYFQQSEVWSKNTNGSIGRNYKQKN